MINQNWIFGRNAGLNFSAGSPTPSSGNSINTMEGCASISDESGNLIMYTDGMTVWDGANIVRASGLQGNSSSTQSSIIVPNPSHTRQYYVFTADGASGGNNHFNGILIDTSSWVVASLASLMTMPPTAGFSSTEKLTTIQHANCKDFWVLTIIQKTREDNVGNARGTLRVFLVNSSGVQHVGDTPMAQNVADLGYLKASQDGQRIAIANWQNQNVLVYGFDNLLGTIDLPSLITITVPTIPNKHSRATYGVEFSPSSRVLYYTVIGDTSVSPTGNGYVFQHDLLNPNTPSVECGMHPNSDDRYSLGALQIGQDDRIYIAQDGESRLGIINSPNVLGAGCNLTFSAINLAEGSICYLGLPNLIPNLCDCACDEGNCDDAVQSANQLLSQQADKKTFKIIANGQTMPASCSLAFQQHDFAPIFSIRWGDGPSDRFESHDTEIIYIQAHNPFRNLTFRGVKIFNIQITPNQMLPSGGNALQIIPSEIACFDMIEPCSSVSRDFVFLIQNTIAQAYTITFDYCIEEITIVAAGNGTAAFPIRVVAS